MPQSSLFRTHLKTLLKFLIIVVMGKIHNKSSKYAEDAIYDLSQGINKYKVLAEKLATDITVVESKTTFKTYQNAYCSIS